MSDIANLQIRVTSDGIEAAKKRLNDLATTAPKAERELTGLTKASASLNTSTGSLAVRLGGMVAPLVGIGTAVAGMRKLIEVNREFDKLNAGLITATGSAEGARSAFGVLEEFATRTPYSLRETTDAYVKLVNYGLNPSERALTSYGNTASALGKGIGDMIEAVADAQVLEFERLKEFGVKAKQEGDKVQFTFRGVKTTVAKDSQQIQDYLIKLGETNFGGAMAERMKTLDGALSNLGDAWDKLFRTIGSSSVGDAMKDSITLATDALSGMIDVLKSDTLAAAFREYKKYWVDVAAYAELAALAVRASSPAALLAGDKVDLRGEYARIRDTQAATKMDIDAEANRKKYGAEYDAATAGLGMGGAGTQTAGLPSLYAPFAPASKGDKGKAELAKEAAAAKKAKRDRDKEEDDARKAEEARYRKARDEDKAVRAEHARKVAEEIKQDFQAAEEVRKSLLKPREAAAEEYQRSLGILNMGAGSEQDKSRLSEKYRRELRDIQDAEDERRQALYDGFKTEEQLLKDAEAKKLQLVKEARDERLITAEQEADLKLKIVRDTAAKERALDAARLESSMTSSSAIFGNLATAAKNIGGEQSAAYRTLFSIQKGFAVASTSLAMYQAMAKGLEKGWAGLPEMLQGAALGASLIAQVSSTNYSGAYDRGGYIPGGSVGVVGEYGPELVRGPAQVTGREETAALGRGSQPVTVVVAPDQASAEQFMASSRGERAFLALAQRNSTAIRRMVNG